MTSNSSPSQSQVTRIERQDPGRDAPVNPLLRIHLLLYNRYKWAILLGVILAVAGSTLAWHFLPPKYEVVGYVNVKPYIPPIFQGSDLTGMLPAFESVIGTQQSILQSQRVLDQASEDPNWKALGRMKDGTTAKISEKAVRVQHLKGSSQIVIGVTDTNVKTAAVAARAILKAYKAISDETNPANITGRLATLEELRTTETNQKNAIIKQIQELSLPFRPYDPAERYARLLVDQNDVESQLNEVDLQLAIAQAGKDLTGQGAELGGEDLGLASTNPALPAIRGVAGSQPKTTPPVSMADIARLDPHVRNMQDQKSQMLSRYNQLSTRVGPSNPDIVALDAQLADIQSQLDSALAAYQQRATEGGFNPAQANSGPLKPSLDDLRFRKVILGARFGDIKNETQKLYDANKKIEVLREQQDDVSKKLKDSSERIDQLNLDAKNADRIEIGSWGDEPTAPIASKRIPLTAAMGIFGLAAGASLIALRGLADRRVNSFLHMQQLAPALRVLGVLPVLPRNLADPEQAALAAHCVHQIRSLLEAMPAHDKGRVLAVTSPSAGDGKTSLALSLGLSFAASGSRTLLIDCDMIGRGLTRRLNAIARRRMGSILRKQGLLTDQQVKEALRVATASKQRFGEVLVELGYLSASQVQTALADQSETSVGVMEALEGESLLSCVAATGSERLAILPLGNASADNSSRISAKALRRLIKEARTDFDVVIFDTGPLLGSIEASVAVREVDEVILAVTRGASSPLVTKTVEQLHNLGAHLGGVVFNRATTGDVEYSNSGSAASLRSLRSSHPEENPTHDASTSGQVFPRLGPMATAVAGNAQDSEIPAHVNGKNSGNGTANGKHGGPQSS